MKTFLKPLTISEERVFLEQLKQGERKAKDVLVERNMRLVAHIVKKYSQTDYEMEDLISIGTIGLIKAVDTFNPDRANRLGTYAAKCIDKPTQLLRLLSLKKGKMRGFIQKKMTGGCGKHMEKTFLFCIA